MATSITTLKSIAAAATVGMLVACGAPAESDVSSGEAGDPTGGPTTFTPDPLDDSVPWGRLPDGDRIERSHDGSPTGRAGVDPLLPY